MAVERGSVEHLQRTSTQQFRELDRQIACIVQEQTSQRKLLLTILDEVRSMRYGDRVESDPVSVDMPLSTSALPADPTSDRTGRDTAVTGESENGTSSEAAPRSGAGSEAMDRIIPAVAHLVDDHAAVKAAAMDLARQLRGASSPAALDKAARRAPVAARYDAAAATTWLNLHPKLGSIPVDSRLLSSWHRRAGHKPPGTVRLAFISDTHSQQVGSHGRRAADGALHLPPDTDVLIHCGDFSVSGRPDELEDFVAWFSSMGPPSCRHRVVIHGNHDGRLFLPPDHRKACYKEGWAEDSERLAGRTRGVRSIHTSEGGGGAEADAARDVAGAEGGGGGEGPAEGVGAGRRGAGPRPSHRSPRHRRPSHLGPEGQRLEADAVLLRKGVLPLHDECTTVAGGVVICGLPWTSGPREFGESLGAVPGGGAVDVLLTHGPPAGHGDDVVRWSGGRTGARLGSPRALTESCSRIRPLVHAFGHIHEGYGVTVERVQAPTVGCGSRAPSAVVSGAEGLSLDRTLFVNASSCDRWQRLRNAPVVVDVRARDPGFGLTAAEAPPGGGTET